MSAKATIALFFRGITDGAEQSEAVVVVVVASTEVGFSHALTV